MRNVTVYDRKSNDVVGEFDYLPDKQEDKIAVLVDKLGYGTYKLRWKERKRTEKGIVEFPKQETLFCLKPGGLFKEAARPLEGSPSAPVIVREADHGENSFVVKLLLEKIQAIHDDLARRIDVVLDVLEEDDPTADYEPGKELAGIPAMPGSMGDVFKSVMADPAYAGIVGGILANMGSPEKMADVIKAETDKNPALIAGLAGRMIPLMMQGGES